MVAIAVLLTIVGLLLLDLLVQYVESRLAPVPGNAKQSVSVPDLPPGLFFHPGHSWAQLDPGGVWRVGVDSLVAGSLGQVDEIKLPEPGTPVREGDPLATIVRAGLRLVVRSPVTGEVQTVNPALSPAAIVAAPYTDGWLCVLKPEALAEDTRRLAIGADAARWHQAEAARIAEFLAGGGVAQGSLDRLGEPGFRKFQKAFLDAAG